MGFVRGRRRLWLWSGLGLRVASVVGIEFPVSRTKWHKVVNLPMPTIIIGPPDWPRFLWYPYVKDDAPTDHLISRCCYRNNLSVTKLFLWFGKLSTEDIECIGERLLNESLSIRVVHERHLQH